MHSFVLRLTADFFLKRTVISVDLCIVIAEVHVFLHPFLANTSRDPQWFLGYLSGRGRPSGDAVSVEDLEAPGNVCHQDAPMSSA